MGKNNENNNSLIIKNPKLAAQWHPSKNGAITPDSITPGSSKKVWWLCEQGHEWEAIIANRTKGIGCPFCSGRYATAENNLQVLNPGLSKQWHPIKNKDLTPVDVMEGSNKKVWWQCERGHEWEAKIASRAKDGNACPYCAGQRVCEENSLQILNPELSKQWNTTKNGDLTPNDVTAGSSKKVWWICAKGHEWEAFISNRVKGNGCPYCAGQYVDDNNSLQTLNQELSKQWHPIKNGNLTPNDVASRSSKYVWWLCEKGHEWEDSINHRANDRGCPYCSGKRVCEDNSLHMLNPELSREWHPVKNGKLTPNDVTTGSNRKVWWRCRKGHEWQAIVAVRVSGTNCPVCSKEYNTSFPEQAIYFYLKNVFSDTLNRHKYLNEWELDVFVPSLRLGIEYDGIYYHHNNEVTDSAKNEYFITKNICLLRIKETKNKATKCYHKDNVIYCNRRLSDTQLNEVIIACFNFITENVTGESYIVDIDVKRDRAKIFDLYITNEKENSLLAKYPELSLQWHPTKNSNLKPDMVMPNSNKKVWWQCGKGHEWEALINSRSRINGTGCPYCSGRIALAGNSLQALNPELSKQWHPSKNGELTPNDVKTGTHRKAWWICDKGHEWEAAIYARNSGSGCPYCSGKNVHIDNSLQFLNPELSRQWHPTKNGNLKPSDVTKGSGKKVWWQCEKGHEWEAQIARRVGGTGCPFCSGRRANSDSCLETINPNLAIQWHPTKNGDLKPSMFSPNSNKKAWWICELGHEWEAVISSRNHGKGCPYCSGRRTLIENSLLIQYPNLSKQWHPTNNGTLMPGDVSTGSSKKVWWQCEKEHDWEATIYNRVHKKQDCPHCNIKKSKK